MNDEPGVPLGHYRTHGPGMGVEFDCLECAAWFSVPLETVIERLEQRQLGGAHTGVRDVAQFAEKPCPQCGSRRFTTRPHFPAAPHTPHLPGS